MPYEYCFVIKMNWEKRKKVFRLTGIFAPTERWARFRLKQYVREFIGKEDYTIKRMLVIYER